MYFWYFIWQAEAGEWYMDAIRNELFTNMSMRNNMEFAIHVFHSFKYPGKIDTISRSPKLPRTNNTTNPTGEVKIYACRNMFYKIWTQWMWYMKRSTKKQQQQQLRRWCPRHLMHINNVPDIQFLDGRGEELENTLKPEQRINKIHRAKKGKMVQCEEWRQSMWPNVSINKFIEVCVLFGSTLYGRAINMCFFCMGLNQVAYTRCGYIHDEQCDATTFFQRSRRQLYRQCAYNCATP